MVILGWSKSNFVTSMDIYQYTYPSDQPVYSLRPQSYLFDFEEPVYEHVSLYNEDMNMRTGYPAYISGYPVLLANIKYYNAFLSHQDALKECIKYTTTHENCVINDLCRPIDDGHGYAVK